MAGHHPAANPITARNIVPDLGNFGELNLWASIAFAFAGLELSSAMGGEVRDPRRTLPRAILIAAPLIALVYILGTGALLWLVPAGDINIVSGFLQATDAGARQLSPALWWLAPLCGRGVHARQHRRRGRVAHGPGARRVRDRARPVFPARVRPRAPEVEDAVRRDPRAGVAGDGVPARQPCSARGRRWRRRTSILLDTQLLIYFIPYCYLFISFLKQSAGRERAVRHWLVGAAGCGVTLFAMTVASIPPEDTPDKGAFLLKVVGGAAAFVGLGVALYQRGRRRR